MAVVDDSVNREGEVNESFLAAWNQNNIDFKESMDAHEKTKPITRLNKDFPDWPVKEALLAGAFCNNVDRGKNLIQCQKNNIESIKALTVLTDFYSNTLNFWCDRVHQETVRQKRDFEAI